MISVIIPFLNKWELTHARLNEFYRFLPPKEIEVVLINDASTEDGCITGVAWWQKTVNPFPIKYHANKENYGFGRSMNIGAKIASGDILVFYSNDVKTYANWIPELVSRLNGNDKVLLGNEVIYWDGGWNSFEINGKKTIVPYANGWFIACTREIWLSLKGFDWKTFGKYDYEDVDLSAQAIELGYNIVALNSRNLEHAHQGSTIETLNVDREALTKQNREKFIAKWGNRLTNIQSKLEQTDDGERSTTNT